MPETCPVCGDAVEHRRTERADTGGDTTAGASFDIDDLCAVDTSTRWDRICAAATPEETDGDDTPVLELYYHFFGDGE